MKSTTIILFFILFPAIAQNKVGEADVNVKEIVEQQISEAKKKMEKQNLLNTDIMTLPKEQKTESLLGKLDINSIETRALVLSGFSILVFSFVAVRRYKKKDRPDTNQLKKNIQLMREEKFIRPIDPRLKKIRTNLFLNSRYLNEDCNSLSNTARRYNIAKTELILASRFKKETLRAKLRG